MEIAVQGGQIMMPHRCAALILTSLLFTLTARAQPPAEPLPPGAKLQLGTTRMRDATLWPGATLSPDGKHLVGDTPDGFASVDVSTGMPAGKPVKREGSSRRNVVSADGTRVASLAVDGVTVWDRASGESLTKFGRRTAYENGAAALSTDGKILAVGGVRDNSKPDAPVTAVVWDVEKKAKRAEVTVLQNQSANVALSPDGTRLATWGLHAEPIKPGTPSDPAKDHTRDVQFWDAVTGQPLGRTRIPAYGRPVVAFSPDGKTAAVGNGVGTVQLIDSTTGTVQRQLYGRTNGGYVLAFSPDGTRVAAGAMDGSVQIWQVADGKSLGTTETPFGGPGVVVREIRFTGPDRAVAWSQLLSTAVVWEVPSGKLLFPLEGHVGGVTSVMFSAGGKEVLTGGQDGLVFRWNAATGKEVGEVPLSVLPRVGRFSFIPVTFGPLGTTALSGGNGVYDLATGKPLIALPPYGDTRAMLASDQRTILTVPNIPFAEKAPKPMLVPVWDMVSGLKLGELDLPAGDVLAVAVTPDRTKLVTAVTPRIRPDGKTELFVTAWDLTEKCKKLGEVVDGGGFGNAVLQAAPDNATVLVGTLTERFFSMELTTGKTVNEFDTNQQRVSAAPVFAPDGKTFAIGLATRIRPAGGMIRIYDAATGKPIRTIKGHAGQVLCLAYSPDGKTLASGSTDCTVLLWDVDAKGG